MTDPTHPLYLPVHGIPFALTGDRDSVLGHGYVRDEVSGTTFAVVESGVDLASLGAAIEEALQVLVGHLHDEGVTSPKLVSDGYAIVS